jgi:hypothetical protein
MRVVVGLIWRRRSFTAMILALVAAMSFMVAGAFADAGNPILGTIKASAHDNGDGTVTVYVRGQWNWLSHTSDCNVDRAATGVGIAWGDPTETGYTVANGAVSAQIGTKTKNVNGSWPTDPNPIDQMVHPVDRGNVTEGYVSTLAGDYPSGQQFVDPSPPQANAGAITSTEVNAWKGGCGRQPLSAVASKGSNPDRTGRNCATNPASTTCAGHPWGSWGYEKSGGLGYSHTYLKTLPNGQSGLPSRVCVNFYDVHGGGTGTKFQLVSGTKEIDVDGNGDNSIDTNAFNVNEGLNCITVIIPTLTTQATDNQIGGAVTDTATLSGIPAGTHGTLTFEAYGPRSLTSTTPDCTTKPMVFTSNVSVPSVPAGMPESVAVSFTAPPIW